MAKYSYQSASVWGATSTNVLIQGWIIKGYQMDVDMSMVKHQIKKH